MVMIIHMGKVDKPGFPIVPTPQRDQGGIDETHVHVKSIDASVSIGAIVYATQPHMTLYLSHV